MKTFILPTGHKKDQARRNEVEALRKKVQHVLRPGLEPLPDEKKARFLHWHLSPASFMWKDERSFSRVAKVKTPQWIVSKIIVKNTKQTPPPQGRNAMWDSHDWREIKADGTKGAILVSGSVNHTPPPESKSTKRKLKVVEELVEGSDHNVKRVATWFAEEVQVSASLRDQLQKKKVESEKHLETIEVAREEIKRLRNVTLDQQQALRKSQKREAYIKQKQAETKIALTNFMKDNEDEMAKLCAESQTLQKKMNKMSSNTERLLNLWSGTEDDLAEAMDKNKLLQEKCEAIQLALVAAEAKSKGPLLLEGETEKHEEDEQGPRLHGIRWLDFEMSAQTDKQGKRCKGLSNHVPQLTGFKNMNVLRAFFEFAEAHGSAESSLRRGAKTASGNKPDFDTDSFMFSSATPPNASIFFSFRDRMLVGLFILRTGASHAVASAVFYIAESSVAEYFEFTVLTIEMYSSRFCPIPSADLLESTCPPELKKKFKRTVSYYLDATEIEAEVPDDKEVQKVTFSSYKHRNTAKFLGGLATYGALAWISVAYPGSISDKEISEVSGFLKLVFALQMIIADKGFDGVRSMVQAMKAFFNMPTKKRNKIDQLSEEDNRKTAGIANSRIHIERYFAALKHFRYLDKIRNKQYDLANSALQAAVFITNLNNPPFRGAKSK